MITAYAKTNGSLAARRLDDGTAIPADALWLDLFEPTRAEEKAVEAALGIAIPSREDMQEIEISSRLYAENGASFMIATLMAQADTDNPVSAPVTFVLTGGRLVTLRYIDPTPFQLYAAQLGKGGHGITSGEAAFAGLMDAIIDRLADILERVQRDVDMLSRLIFAPPQAGKKTDFRTILRRIGRNEELTARVRDSLASISRVLSFASRPSDNAKADKTIGRSYKTLLRDAASLSDYAGFLSNSIYFLLDATLGMINIEQNIIIKIFSVAAVVFLPPTLIASIYGMNFEFMPELDSPFGYPAALGLMVLSVILTFTYFKRRGWL
ncbi:MAG: magnesium transporter [Alphaproteobacteria bacterium]|nr:MAG: magnesium transporter [Alphaproteobacteria bacterium]